MAVALPVAAGSRESAVSPVALAAEEEDLSAAQEGERGPPALVAEVEWQAERPARREWVARLGTAGVSGRGGAGGDCRISPGAVSSGPCAATFNFESGMHGAMINTGYQLAFQSIARSGTYTFCGAGALAITAIFSGTSGNTIKGEVLIPLPGAPVDVTNKTITVRVAADPGCSSDLNLALGANTVTGPVYFTPTFPIRPLTTTWKMGMVTLSADAGAMTGLTLSLQAFSTTGYLGTIYVDEIDIK